MRVGFKIYTQIFWISEYDIYTQTARDRRADYLSIENDICHIFNITISMSYITLLPLTWYEIVL